VFARSCSGCHTLTGHDTPARGGDLALARLSAHDVAGFVRVMPVRLSGGDVDAVAAYVHAVAARHG
jgi:mono/diheme cytochrome c family protein